MASLTQVILLLLLALVAWLFWLRRGIAESAKQHVTRYCQTHELQLLSISRIRLSLGMVQGRPGWHTEFSFDFSGNREDRYTGTLSMQNHYATRIQVPPYRTF